MKQKTILSIGAGFPQVDFIRSLKEKGHYVVSIGKGRNSKEAIELSDDFAEVNTHCEDEVISWIKNYSKKIDAVGSYSGGKAIRTLQIVNQFLNLHTEIPEELIIGMDKFSQQELYEKHKLTTIKSWNIREITADQDLIKDVDKFIIKPTIGRGSSGVQIIKKHKLLSDIRNCLYTEDTIIQEFREGKEYRVSALIQNGELKLLAPIERKSFNKTVFLGRLSYDDSHIEAIESYFMKFVGECGIKNVIFKADILVSKGNIDMIEMDIGVGGGIYYKKYLSELFKYDLNNEYINLIINEKVNKANNPAKNKFMDYIYNLSGRPIVLDLISIEKLLNQLIGAHKIIRNLLKPEEHGKFQSNADFIFSIIHENENISNFELNKIINQKLFINAE